MMYDVRPAGTGKWIVWKLEADYSPTAGYTVTQLGKQLMCTCAGSEGKTCRHRAMVLSYEVNPFWKGRFARGFKWDFDNCRWIALSVGVVQTLGER